MGLRNSVKQVALSAGGHCQAYPAFRFRAFPDWEALARGEFADDHVLYLQEDYTVTDGIYQNERVVFDAVSDAWCRFCRDTLNSRLNFRLQTARPYTAI